MKRRFWCLGIGFLLLTLLILPVAGAAAPKQTDIAVGWDHSLVLRPDGSLWAWGYNGYGQLGLGHSTDQNTPTLISGRLPGSLFLLLLKD